MGGFSFFFGVVDFFFLVREGGFFLVWREGGGRGAVFFWVDGIFLG